jgi:hypothetical protein
MCDCASPCKCAESEIAKNKNPWAVNEHYYTNWGQIYNVPDYCDCAERCQKCGKKHKPYQITWAVADTIPCRTPFYANL